MAADGGARAILIRPFDVPAVLEIGGPEQRARGGRHPSATNGGDPPCNITLAQGPAHLGIPDIPPPDPASRPRPSPPPPFLDASLVT